MTLLVFAGVLVSSYDPASLLGCLVGHVTVLVPAGALVTAFDPASVWWGAGEPT
jgi:hypothetical protein